MLIKKDEKGSMRAFTEASASWPQIYDRSRARTTIQLPLRMKPQQKISHKIILIFLLIKKIVPN